MPVMSCSGTNTKSNFSGHVIITTIIKWIVRLSYIDPGDQATKYVVEIEPRTQRLLAHQFKLNYHWYWSISLENELALTICFLALCSDNWNWEQVVNRSVWYKDHTLSRLFQWGADTLISTCLKAVSCMKLPFIFMW